MNNPLDPKQNPNASVATIGGLLVAQLIWILGLYHLAVPQGIAAGWVTLTIALLLYLGRGQAK